MAHDEMLHALTVAKSTGLAMGMLVAHRASTASLLLGWQGRDVLYCGHSALADALFQLLIVEQNCVVIATGEIKTAVFIIDHGQPPRLPIVMRSDQDFTLSLLWVGQDVIKLQDRAIFQARQNLLAPEVHRHWSCLDLVGKNLDKILAGVQEV